MLYSESVPLFGLPVVQISSTSLTSSLPIVAPTRRDSLSDSKQQSNTVLPATPVEDNSARGEVTRIRTRPSPSTQQAYDNGPNAEQLQSLSARSRTAVTSYLNNGPSVEERLGVELAGVDTFA